MPLAEINYMSVEAYLEIKTTSLEKHEYYQGKIYAKNGASIVHNKIAFNLIDFIRNQRYLN
jgi:Uma2 family endonuclease